MPLNESFSRRAALAFGAAAVASVVLPGGARAATTDQAIALVNKISAELIQIVRSSQSDAAALAQFERMFLQYGDVNVIARSVLGPPWNSLNGSQQSAFVSAFQDYLSNKYGTQFREFRDAQVRITGAQDFGAKGILVKTVVSYGREAPFSVDWQVSDRSGQLKMFNVLIEGVSMLSTERSEIRALLAQNGNSVDRLIQDLQRRS